MWEVVSILAAIRRRRTTGEGAYVDLSMLESTIALLPESIIGAGLGGNARARAGNLEPDAAPSGCFRSAGTDEWVAVSVRSDPEWAGLCEALGRADWAADRTLATRAGRLAAKDRLNAGLATWLAERPADGGARRLVAAGVPASRSRSMKDLLADDFLSRIDLFPSLPDGSCTVALPWRDEHGWSGTFRPAPKLGADNDYVLGELLGMSRAEIDRLVEAKVIT
jgi:benzylsuccinate CoA-transferase BbsF subunit